MKEKIDQLIEKGHSYLKSINQYEEQNLLEICSDDETIDPAVTEFLSEERLDIRNFFLYRIQRRMDLEEKRWKMYYHHLGTIKMLI